jgi:fatty acid desaturase
MAVEESNVDPSTLKSLSKLQTWRTALAIVFDWAVIAAAIVVSQAANNIFVYLLAVVIIGGRMHGFGVLMHEFAHYRFIDGRKTLSDFIGDITVAWPILTTVGAYRANHLAHHRYTNTDKDPDWVIKLGSSKFTFPQKWQTAVVTLLSYLAVIGSVLDVLMIVKRLSKLDPTPKSYRIIRLAYYVAFAVFFTVTQSWMLFLLYWLIPYLTAFFLLMYVRSVAEHFASMDYSNELTSTRTVLPFYWERALFAPHNVNYHLEHHLYPSVPYYNLPELHGVLMRQPGYAARAHLTRGYTVGLVHEALAVAAPTTAKA